MPQYTKEQVIQALHNANGLVYVAAKQLGCTPQTVYNHIKKSPDVRAVLDTERGESLDVAELQLMKSIRKGESWAVLFYLKTVGKDRGYTERVEHVVFNVPAELQQELKRELEAAGLDEQNVFRELIDAAKARRALVGADGHREGGSAESE